MWRSKNTSKKPSPSFWRLTNTFYVEFFYLKKYKKDEKPLSLVWIWFSYFGPVPDGSEFWFTFVNQSKEMLPEFVIGRNLTESCHREPKRNYAGFFKIILVCSSAYIWSCKFVHFLYVWFTCISGEPCKHRLSLFLKDFCSLSFDTVFSKRQTLTLLSLMLSFLHILLDGCPRSATMCPFLHGENDSPEYYTGMLSTSNQSTISNNTE